MILRSVSDSRPVSRRWRAWIGGALAALLCGIAAPSLAERRAVLDQIDLPHGYYFRELYLPQLTEGPSSLTWSPDSKELIYSMAGTLWRQSIASNRAVQLTDGDGYDYQPDWSPDGRRVVYSVYRAGAIELWLLDLATGRAVQLTQTGAVNVEARWSPDGHRLAYVSTAGTGHFHVFVAEVDGDRLVHAQALCAEHSSDLRRYYYSRFDHEISPSWSRDGRELVFVSNRGHIHGTGGFWRAEAVPGATPREIHYEETNWRARPEFSPDGAMLLYSSYLGRNAHQLWLLPAAGGDALPLSYGEDEQTGARWSPDGRRIAFLSNRDGQPGLRLMDFPGHVSRALATEVRQTLRPLAELELRVVDGAGRPVPARVSVSDGRAHPYAPYASWLHADDGYDRTRSAVEAHYFHSAGLDVVPVPAEPLTVTVSRGLETPVVQRSVTPVAGRRTVLTVQLDTRRFTTDPDTHWVSGDAHVHMNYGGTYRNTPARLAGQAAGEDLSIVHSLIVNKEQRFPDIAFGGPEGDYADTTTTVVHGQEYHTSYWGHLGVLHLAGGPLLPGYVGYPNTAAASLWPMNADVADDAHAAGALVGYVHPFDEPPDPVGRPRETLTSELPVDVALGKVDYMEILGFSDHRATAGVWYRLLNLGFRLPAAAGTDAMANYASLHGPVGLNRVYVQIPGGEPGSGDSAAWLEGLRAGRTFATNGPLLSFDLDGQGPGGEVRRGEPAAPIAFRARMRSIVPVDHLQIVCNGEVVADLLRSGPASDADVAGTIPLARSGWCVLRADSAIAPYPVLDNYLYATTSPVYVRVGSEASRSTADAAFFVAWIDRILEATEAYPDWRSPTEKAGVIARLREAQAIFRRLGARGS